MPCASVTDVTAQFEIVLETPPAPACSYVSVERAVAKRFSDFLLDDEFESRRVAFLFGRWDNAGVHQGKRGVQVDVIYEPPQTCDAQRVAVADDAESTDQITRATSIANALGLAFVGFAYSHPPRHHTMETAELEMMVELRAIAAQADPEANSSFVCMRFRPVYDDEPIDADVTAEVYQPTEQLAKLVQRGVIRDGGVIDGSGHLGLDQSSGLSFKIGSTLQPTADATYFFTRVHDLAKPYVAPPFGSLQAAFPSANRGAPLRKFHLRTFLAKQVSSALELARTITSG